ncbi:site-specific integrase [Streptomyces sp. NRRL F-5135]|uniref:site-specific integrase n=1 Tax=Streptomyces sp. NRRL F-5135 TaxID=1463858 RepID=UPI0004C8E626|nr:site-specific integrase [Streptomyces sp. NRRL F-5135]
MASVVPRKDKFGQVVSYQVKWRLGGGRTAPWQTERFDDEIAAEVFKGAVTEAGQQWPPGWVKGQGYIDPTAAAPDDERYQFRAYALESVKNRTGVEERYRRDCVRDLENYLFPTFGNCDVRSTEHFSKATVAAWVNKMAKTKVWRGSKHKLMSPKTLKNLHGLLSSVLNEAVEAEPPLRARNPCPLVRLPRTDDDGVDDDGEDMEFMTPEEIAGIVDCLKRPEDKTFVRVAYGTGLRWGEITALAKRHARTRHGEYEIRVSRAWKIHPDDGPYLGTPKTKAARRTVDISAGLWDELQEAGLNGLASGDLIFHNGRGGRLVYSTFYDRWTAAVAAAQEQGLLPDFKHPTFHDVRHSHVAALLSDGHSLTYVQRRLGHESIKTTSDRYGHLLKGAYKAALGTIDRALGIAEAGAAAEEEIPENTPLKDPGKAVYVAHVGSTVLGFWTVTHAEETAERWATERGGAVRVEKWGLDWWIRCVGNGEKEIRDRVPHRAYVWSMGPAVYATDGTERVTEPAAHEPRGQWVWDWEELYTEEPAHASTEWRPGPQAETEASAWGTTQGAVRAAFSRARTDALRICGLHPARRAQDGQPITG